MPKVTNGMLIGDVTWRKSSYSNPHGNCVEWAELPVGLIAVRDSRDPVGAVQIYSRAAMASFVRAAKRDEFGPRAK
jgi:hypothetical protein